ncbi:hypothetical protein MTL_15410 [Methylobacterium goesingense]|nr:hypothetical protein [Methylobacterium goesingense]MCI9881428.1 hypothetical protein [Methylobacterium goesingense]
MRGIMTKGTSKRAAYTIETLSYSSTRLVRLGGRKVAILFPPLDAGGPYQLYPHPDTFRSLTFAGLPAPLRPEFMAFDTLGAVEAFLGIRPAAPAPEALPLAA